MAEEMVRVKMEEGSSCGGYQYVANTQSGDKLYYKASLHEPGITANPVKRGEIFLKERGKNLRRKEKNKNTCSLSSFLQSEW